MERGKVKCDRDFEGKVNWKTLSSRGNKER